jgi:hypothetical protein
MGKEKEIHSELAKALTSPPSNRLYKMAVFLYNSKPSEYNLETDYFDGGVFKSFRLLDTKNEEILINWTLYESGGNPVL